MRRYGGGLEGLQDRADDLEKSGAIPAWSTFAGMLIVAVLFFAALAQLGGGESEPSETAQTPAPTADVEAGRPTTPQTEVVETQPSVVASTEETVTLITSVGDNIEVPRELVAAMEDFISTQSPGSTLVVETTEASPSETGYDLNIKFTTAAGRFLDVDAVASEVDGNWTVDR